MNSPKAANTNTACPICKKPPVEKFHPFCCKRCADVDLGRWLKGSYAIPTEERPSGELYQNEDGEFED